MAHPQVLIVDDSPDITRMLSTFLSSHGFPVSFANDAQAALELMDRELFKIVFTDIQMPGMSGLELLRELKARSPMTIVVMMTAFHEVATVVDCISSGAHDFLVKPIEPLEIVLEAALDAEKKILRWAQALRPSNYPS